MDDLDTLIIEIIKTLKSEVPDKYINAIQVFENLVNRDLLRASYNVLDELKRKKDWKPSTKLLGLIERYQMVF
jgi:hypothetical protein